jgi:GTP:adenosylcobinamide-phosphate guanylyltransferase
LNKFCILAAGRGTRNNNVSGLHKALLPLENKPVISHIIDRIGDVEIVIAVGYKSNQIKTYMDLVHSDKKITYVDVDNYEDVGSGPGYSLLCCKDELQEPFVFTSVDTLVGDDINFMSINENWLGIASVDKHESLSYCLVEGSKYLDKLYYGSGEKAYIGMTGNNESYAETKKVFNNDIVANKSDEAIFIDNGKVVKYFDNEEKVTRRIQRLNYLDNCPDIKMVNENMYSYDYINGELFSNISDESLMVKLLQDCQKKLWKKSISTDDFLQNCVQMYETKTMERIESLSNTDLDKIKFINGVEVEPIKKMLNKIDWDSFYTKSIPSQFHGDFQPENILYDDVKDEFVLIDWRQQFGTSLEVGDTYYDLAKLYHAILINGQSILSDMFDYKIDSDKANLSFYAKSNLVSFMDIFKNFCDTHEYDWKNVELLGILQYLNICTLYENFKGGRYGVFLFLYGKYLLSKHLNTA